MTAWVQEVLATDSTRDAFHAELWNTGCSGTSLKAVAIALSVVGISVTVLEPTSALVSAADSRPWNHDSLLSRDIAGAVGQDARYNQGKLQTI